LAPLAEDGIGNSFSNILNWWGAPSSAAEPTGRLTSSNGRQAPYNAIYSRITTQSNTYTVHWRVQSLHKVTGASITFQPTWTEGVDQVTSELRGSTLIERYIDPNAGSTYAQHVSDATILDNSLPDYADPNIGPTANPITYYYKWRVDNETYFQPQP